MLYAPPPAGGFLDVAPRERGDDPDGIYPKDTAAHGERRPQCEAGVYTVNVWASFEVDCSVDVLIRAGGAVRCE